MVAGCGLISQTLKPYNLKTSKPIDFSQKLKSNHFFLFTNFSRFENFLHVFRKKVKFKVTSKV